MEEQQFERIANLLLNEIEPDLNQAKDFFELERISQEMFKKLFQQTLNLHLNPKQTVDPRKKKTSKLNGLN